MIKDLKKQIPYKWRDVVGFENKYIVSNNGDVASVDRIIIDSIGRQYFREGKILKPTNVNGYMYINLGRKKRMYIHRLVGEAFISNKENKPEINHIDGNKSNNKVENLEWVTSSENKQHAQDTGLNKSRYSLKQKLAARINVQKTPSMIKHNLKLKK